MGRYLSNGSLCLRIGEALFVHGALPLTRPVLKNVEQVDDFWNDLSFAMPWKVAESKESPSIEKWIEELTDFTRKNIGLWKVTIEDWEESGTCKNSIWATQGGYSSEDSYNNLIQYGMGWTNDGVKNPTVVYQSWNTGTMPSRFYPPMYKSEEGILFEDLTLDFCRRSGIRLICCGHQPQGDIPTPIQIGSGEAWILCCDTSYSGDTKWWATGRENVGRGSSVGGRGEVAGSEVLLKQCTETGRLLDVSYHGTLSDGSSYESCNLVALDNDGHDDLLPGQLATTLDLLPDESPLEEAFWWIKAKMSDGTHLLSSSRDYDVWNYAK